MSWTRANTANEGANGATITIANSGGRSGDAFDYIVATPGASYNTSAFEGAFSIKCTTSGTAKTFGWLDGSTGADIYQRAYFFIPSFAANTGVMQFSNSSHTTVAGVYADVTGRIQASGYVAAGTVALSTSHWYRLESHFHVDASSGYFEWRVYDGATQALIDSASSAAISNTTGIWGGQVEFGNFSATSSVVYVDAMAASDVTWLGAVTITGFTHVGTDKSSFGSFAANPTTFTVTAGTTNDLRVVFIVGATTTNYVASLSGGGVTTWTQAASFPAVGASIGQTVTIWYGSITGSGTSLSATWHVTPSFGVGTYQIDFRSPASGVRPWTVKDNNSTVGTVNPALFPALTSANAGEVYAGFAYYNGSYTSGGTGAGFIFVNNASLGAPVCYNGNLGASTVYTPTAPNTTAGAKYITAAVIIDDGSAPLVNTSNFFAFF